ncbi:MULTISPECIES: VOC family protein [unclassified Paraburkholderia]|uniref:VOC family protein n=1 Tax=unclassified Paraburkholderia TaxID=2615204 RepID=UPI001621282C|nr:MULTISPECIES: VOC family protein [unclassified Paraburkholderia]MBB5444790.1 PhnB protein [Paraburkholderia sp. WSM4177]MBB5483722.1 PhnB protein [Paraburkholderia sp. WSM4180]
MEIQPYLFFNGRCEEAIEFYRSALGAQELLKLRVKDAPPDPARPVAPEHADKILHATLVIGNTHVLMSDGDCRGGNAVHAGFSLSVTAADQASGEKYFNALADGGQITMPFQQTFWTSGFGTLIDRFGVPWMVNVRHEEPTA